MGQKSFQFPVADNDSGGILYVDVGEDNYCIVQALPSGEPITGYPIIKVTTFDACGPVEAIEFTHPDIYGVSSFVNAFLQEDSIRIVFRNSAGSLHSSSEVGILSFHKDNFGHSYHYIRADNSAICRVVLPIENDRYFAQVFLSYTNRPPVYASLILDKDFSIIHMFENFEEWTVTGGSIELEDGIITSTSTKYYKLDKEMNLVWLKSISSKHRIGNFINVGDGILMRARHYEPGNRGLSIVKLDYDGNLIWQSQNLDFNDWQFIGYKMETYLANEEIRVAVQKRDNGLLVTDQFFIYTLDINSGQVIKSISAVDNNVVPDFNFLDFHVTSGGHNSVLLHDDQDQHILWNVSGEDGNCSLSGSGTVRDAEPFVLQDAALVNSKQDLLYTGNYTWLRQNAAIEAELFCESPFVAEEILPEDTIACEEIPLVLDGSSIPFNIIWEDGSTDKIRTIVEEGVYSYRIDHCSLEFEESINVTQASCKCKIYYPSVFSPNGDGINDTYTGLHSCTDITDFSLSIYDRWGELIFHTIDPAVEWNGRFRQSKAPSGVYSYISHFTSFLDQTVVSQSGAITLLN